MTPSLFDVPPEGDEKRLRDAGWRPVDYAGVTRWQAPDGAVTSWQEALRRLDAEEKRKEKP